MTRTFEAFPAKRNMSKSQKQTWHQQRPWHHKLLKSENVVVTMISTTLFKMRCWTTTKECPPPL
jgi:hypothetical protein